MNAPDSPSSGPGDEEALFHALAGITDPEALAAEFARIADPFLRERMQRLLAAATPGTMWLDRGAAELIEPEEALLIGSRIGRYIVESLIGEGGMGAVYKARQVEPFERTVALKIVHGGFATSGILARFQKERQILAKLHHPNIAHVYDAGTIFAGAPYFVMELVEGLPITEHCERHELGMRDRLRLFQEVCLAIHHAHQQGIIHCDIKPSNVLVARVGERVLTKVIDFGIAKALQEDPVASISRTLAGGLVGTPEYMSPEQLANDPAKIDGRTDVYALGALLYELVSGVPPFSPGALRSCGLEGMCRMIREHEPSPPSRHLTSRGEHGSDLDRMVLKALSKQPEHRYENAEEQAADVERFLTGEPVMATSPTVAYLAGKWMAKRRAKLSVGAGALILALSFGVFYARETAALKAQAQTDAQYAAATEEAAALLSYFSESHWPQHAELPDLAERFPAPCDALWRLSRAPFLTKQRFVQIVVADVENHPEMVRHAGYVINALLSGDADERVRMMVAKEIEPVSLGKAIWPLVWQAHLADSSRHLKLDALVLSREIKARFELEASPETRVALIDGVSKFGRKLPQEELLSWMLQMEDPVALGGSAKLESSMVQLAGCFQDDVSPEAFLDLCEKMPNPSWRALLKMCQKLPPDQVPVAYRGLVSAPHVDPTIARELFKRLSLEEVRNQGTLLLADLRARQTGLKPQGYNQILGDIHRHVSAMSEAEQDELAGIVSRWIDRIPAGKSELCEEWSVIEPIHKRIPQGILDQIAGRMLDLMDVEKLDSVTVRNPGAILTQMASRLDAKQMDRAVELLCKAYIHYLDQSNDDSIKLYVVPILIDLGRDCSRECAGVYLRSLMKNLPFLEQGYDLEFTGAMIGAVAKKLELEELEIAAGCMHKAFQGSFNASSTGHDGDSGKGYAIFLSECGRWDESFEHYLKISEPEMHVLAFCGPDGDRPERVIVNERFFETRARILEAAPPQKSEAEIDRAIKDLTETRNYAQRFAILGILAELGDHLDLTQRKLLIDHLIREFGHKDTAPLHFHLADVIGKQLARIPATETHEGCLALLSRMSKSRNPVLLPGMASAIKAIPVQGDADLAAAISSVFDNPVIADDAAILDFASAAFGMTFRSRYEFLEFRAAGQLKGAGAIAH